MDIEPAGEALLRVSSLPADIKADGAEDFIREITKMLSEMKTSAERFAPEHAAHDGMQGGDKSRRGAEYAPDAPADY